MAYELKQGQGTLFKNDKKGNEKRPDYRGEINVDGTTLELAAWIKDGKKGKYMSLSVKPKEAREDRPRAEPAGATSGGMKDDDIPFMRLRRNELL